MTHSFVFTRYLYIKDEVELSLVTSLLNNDKKSIFWAYELYYSGFEEELFSLFWKIYYDFYATLNPTFWEYLAKKHKEYLSSSLDNDKLVSMIVNNLLIRPYNLDIFLLRQQQPSITESNDLFSFLEIKDYASIARCILTENQTINIANTVFQFLCSKDNSLDRKKMEKKWANAITCSHIHPGMHLLSIIMSFFSKESGVKMGKNLYIIIDPDDIIPYATILVNTTANAKVKVNANKILQKACIHNIDTDSYLSLFQLSRYTIPGARTYKEAYYYEWLYYASFSPLWLSRIKKHKGYINSETKQILFKESSTDSDDNEQKFYSNYGYEPDEQSAETQQKNIQDITNIRTWTTFYENKKKNGLYIPNLSEMVTIQY